MSEETLATMDCTEINPDPIIHLTENGVQGFEVLCRLCANRSDHLIPIYSEEGVSNDLADKMNMYLPIKVTKTDVLPLQCCFQCATTVLTWHELIVATLEADRRLREVQLEVEKQLLPVEDVEITPEPEPGTSQEEDELKHEEMVLPNDDDEDDDDDGYNEVTVVYVEDDGQVVEVNDQEIYNAIIEQKKSDDQKVLENEVKSEALNNVSEEEVSDLEEDDEDDDDDYTVNENDEDDQMDEYQENDEGNEDDEADYEEDENQENENSNEASELSNHSAKVAEELIDFEEKIKNTVLAVRAPKDKECEVCSKKFRRLSNLNSHISTHVSDFCCYVCCKSFNTHFKLNCHLVEHPADKKILRKLDPAFMMCKEGCGQKFYSRLKLFQHMAVHRKQFVHTCGVCEKKFSTFSQLNAHKKVHQSKTCNDCHRSYIHQHVCPKHFVRRDLVPVKCKICGAAFRHMGLLKNHETIHSDDKKFKCPHCQKSFGRSNYLSDHIKTHFVDKPFKCNKCDAAFTQKNILISHIQMKHRVCSLCDTTVGDSMQLRVHLWKFHGREDPEFDIVEVEEVEDKTK